MAAAVEDETIEFRIPSNPRYVPTIRRAIRSIATNLAFPDETASDIELSVGEALVNAIEHGSPEQNRNTVVVTCRISQDNLTIDVRDEGPGFDAVAYQSSPELLDERGRGLTLIYNLMDNVRLCSTSRGARIRMVKTKRCPVSRQKTYASP